jgi:flavin reductase (DIM6/NTAB) family NADH-FMN oxidoreductase RutF
MEHEVFDPSALDTRTRYQLLTSIVVPRPIGWISTYGPDETPNLAPYSYFAALSAAPMLIGVSIGHRRSGPKDTLVNIRRRGGFCTNMVTRRHLEAMNATSGGHPPDVSEFAVAGLEARSANQVDAPWVAGCPVVMECRLFKEVALEGAPNTLVIGEVVRILVDSSVPRAAESQYLDTETLDPVARLWGPTYGFLGEFRTIPRPKVD